MKLTLTNGETLLVEHCLDEDCRSATASGLSAWVLPTVQPVGSAELHRVDHQVEKKKSRKALRKADESLKSAGRRGRYLSSCIEVRTRFVSLRAL